MNNNHKILTFDEDTHVRDAVKVLNFNNDTAGPKGTQIIIKNKNTGEILGEYTNKTVIAGSQYMATTLFGVDKVVNLPNYNNELGIENAVQTTPDNLPIVCLFAVGINGCGTENSQRYPVQYTGHIPYTSLIPFRYEKGSDLDSDMRSIYFGRKVVGEEGNSTCRYAYYYKAITSKQLHATFVDGTEVDKNIYSNSTRTKAITYVESQLDITKSDCRDIFSSGDFYPTYGDGTAATSPLTLADARINSLSLLSAWYKTNEDNSGNVIKYYQDVIPFSEVHFANVSIEDSTISLEVLYRVFF